MRDKIENIVRGILGKHSKDNLQIDGIYVAPHIEPKYASRAANQFGAGAEPEDIILLVDYKSLMKKGSQGIILTDRCIYRSEDSNGVPSHIEIKDIVSVDFKASGAASILYINGNPFYPELTARSAKCLADILFALRDELNRLSQEKEDIPEKLRQLETLRTEQLISDTEYKEIRARHMTKL
ncbi:MAG: hypothetical protein ACSHX4_07945 [Opitutaceae bacterium]